MSETHQIICIGSVLWDVIGRTPEAMELGNDKPGRIERLPGGVAMNIAMALARGSLCPVLLTALGRDEAGDALVSFARAKGMVTDHVTRLADHPTDIYMAIEGAGGLVAALADAHSLEAAGPAIFAPLVDGTFGSAEAPFVGPVVLDGNLTVPVLEEIAASPAFAAADLRVAPASPGKAERMLPLLGHPGVTLYVNLEEAGLICSEDFHDTAAAARAVSAKGAARVLVTDGAAATVDARGEDMVAAVPPEIMVVRVTGAGDTFMAAHIAAELGGAGRAEALASAQQITAAYVSGETEV
ncbi:kinase [Alphaproteobacteria bacterium KMM 3653]|uniref:Kinase n=1 Tax=Harenicola maris TaxID=2841044 RepID=A0AAP2CM54_9RHOB|nr:kinase [Harenicola maris]